MIDANGIVKIGTVEGVTYGVSIGDLQTVFGTSRNDIGQIIVNENINKWAKFKPIRYNKLGILTDGERVEKNQGLVMTKYISPTEFIGGYEDDYAYLRPRGAGQTPQEWFRFLDFDGYNHEAVGPVSSFACPSGDVVENQDIIVRLYLNPSSQVPDGSLIWSDFNPDDDALLTIADYYFGVIIHTVGTSTYRTLTMDTAVGTGYPIQERALTLPASLFTVTQSYTIYPILSRDPIAIGDPAPYRTGFYSVPDAEPRTIQIRTNATFVSIGITAFTATADGGNFSWSLTGVMQVNGNTTVTGQILYRIYEGTYNPDTGQYSGSIINSGEFYYGQIAMAPNQTTHTKSVSKKGTSGYEYLTAVLSYQGTDCAPVTTQVQSLIIDLD